MRYRALMLLVAALPCIAAAQVPRMEPGQPHRELDFLVGEWTVESRMYMRDEVHSAQHAAEIRWLPGGVWLEENVEMSDTPIGDMFGSARTAWDDRAKEYVRYWTDNQSHVRKFVRNTHRVRDATGAIVYRGETVYAWDPVAGTVVWWYWNSTGGYVTGSMQETEEGWVFEGTNHAPPPQPEKVKSLFRFQAADL